MADEATHHTPHMDTRGDSKRKRPDAKPGRLVDSLFQFLAGAETRHFARGNMDRLAGTRITAFARRALRDTEGSEADEANLIAFLQRGADAFKHGIDRTLGVRLFQARSRGNSVN